MAAARRTRRAAALFLLGAAAALAGACKSGVRWELADYPEGQRRAARENRLMLVYFRDWYSVACTDFEEHVLTDAEIVAETNAMLCIPLDFAWDRKLAQEWGLRAAPAIAIVTPEGAVVGRRSAPLSREDLLRELRAARRFDAAQRLAAERARRGPASQPADAPP